MRPESVREACGEKFARLADGLLWLVPDSLAILFQEWSQNWINSLRWTWRRCHWWKFQNRGHLASHARISWSWLVKEHRVSNFSFIVSKDSFHGQFEDSPIRWSSWVAPVSSTKGIAWIRFPEWNCYWSLFITWIWKGAISSWRRYCPSIGMKELSISPSSLLLSWARQQNIPVIPKSCNLSRIADNFAHQQLPQSVIDKLSSIGRSHRYIDPINFGKFPCLSKCSN